MRQPQYHITLTDAEYQLVLEAMLFFRSKVIRENGPSEDIDELILKLTRRKKRWCLF